MLRRCDVDTEAFESRVERQGDAVRLENEESAFRKGPPNFLYNL